MSKYFNYLLSVIPFEVNFFEKYGLRTTYVGHPFIEKVKKIDDKNFSNQFDLLKSVLWELNNYFCYFGH